MPETLSATVEGAYGVAALTDCAFPGSVVRKADCIAVFTMFREHHNADRAAAAETAQGKALVDASKAAGVKHFFWL